MKLELRRFKNYPRLSEETEAFNADLWIDGKKACGVSNDGHGGCTMFDDWDVHKKVEAWAKTLPPHVSEYGELEMSADFYVALLVEKLVAENEVKKFVKRLRRAVQRPDDVILVGATKGRLEGVVVPFSPKAIEARQSQLAKKGLTIRTFDAKGEEVL